MRNGTGALYAATSSMNSDPNHKEAGTDGIGFTEALPIDPSRHPMGPHLWDYVQSKVHHLAKQRTWKRIVVIGKYCRSGFYVISKNEKQLKRFNWYRPTARIIDESTLEIACFAGRYYVQHYALLIATYLHLTGVDSTLVEYEHSPDISQGLNLFTSQLEGLGEVNTVIVGYVDRLEDIIDGEWTSTPTNGHDIFSWKKSRGADGKVTALLACMISFWGDISIHLIQALAKHGMTRFLYIGKGAALQPQHHPNEVLATGDQSRLDASTITSWQSAITLNKDVPVHVVSGIHANVPSPLLSDNTWTEQQRALGSQWADSEVGLMAQECSGLGISFGWMHVVSDNLTATGEAHGLWNEDSSVQERRAALLKEVGSIIQSQLNG